MLYQILPRYDHQFQVDTMRMFLKTLSGTKRRRSLRDRLSKLFDPNCILDYRFIIDCDGKDQTDGMISFYLQVSDERENNLVLNSLQNMFQDKANVFEAVRPLTPYTTVHTLFTDDVLDHAKKDTKKSLATFRDDQIFLFLLGTMRNKTRITIDFSVEKNYSVTKSMLRGVSTDVDVQVMIKVSGKTRYQRNQILEITNTIINLTAGEKELRAIYRDTYKFSKLTGNELMNLFQIPTFYNKKDLEILKRIHKLEIGQRTLKEEEFASGIKCGHVYHPMQDRVVFLKQLQLRKHMVISGQTGSGKSSFAEEMMRDILTSIVQGKKNIPGFTFFDPAETSVLGVIDMMLKLQADGHDITKLREKIHYIDFGYEDCIFPISLLNKDVPSTEILDYFRMLFGSAVTVQVDRMITSAINTILLDEEEHTIMDIPKMFQDETMRERLYERLKDNVYADDACAFLKGRFDKQQVDPILNRTDPFINTPKKKLMFGMHSKYDGLRKVSEWIEKGDIILFNLKGLNDNDLRIIVGYISLKYYLIGLKRPDNSRLHLTFIDECHKVQFDIYERWLAELRKGGMALIPMTQYLEQFQQGFLKAVLGNAGTKVTFRQGRDGAVRMSANLPGHPDIDGLQGLPDRIGYVSTEDNRIAKTVLVEVDPPYRYNAGKVVPHKEGENVQAEMNTEKNRNEARSLMRRDFLSKEEAEKIVFRKIKRRKKGDGEWDG
ncbi:ATP-binding protein [[Clostridium] innocuum]|nr:hypothetical protein HMPREF0982_02918 [Erysipelotrichaceae bacterium 21_3]MCR0303226.1 ATP-binding protein [[Clostridium] innocuum]